MKKLPGRVLGFAVGLLALLAISPAYAIIKSIAGPTATPFAIGAPTSRSLSLATAYQATDPSMGSVVTVNLSSTAGLTLAGGTSNTADIVIGPTSSVAGGTGNVVGKYANSLTGSLVVGLAVNTTSASPITFTLPAGWYFAVRQTAGSITITSAFDQSAG